MGSRINAAIALGEVATPGDQAVIHALMDIQEKVRAHTSVATDVRDDAAMFLLKQTMSVWVIPGCGTVCCVLFW